MSIVVQIGVHPSPGRVEVRWDRSLGIHEAAFQNAMFEELCGVHGVQEVEMRRYCAVLSVATWVVPISFVAQEVIDWLRSQEFLECMRFVRTDYTFDIVDEPIGRLRD